MSFTLRAITPAEFAAVHALHVRIERHDGLPISTPLGEFLDWSSEPDLDLAADTRLLEAGGALAGWGRIWHQPSGVREERAFLMGAVAPEQRGRGLGRALLGWQIERSGELLRAATATLPRFVRTSVYDFERPAQRLFERLGMRVVRHSAEMVRDLATPLPTTPVADVTIAPWDRARDEDARRVMNDAFADHWGSTPRGPEAWRHALEQHGVRLDLSFHALEAGRLVGVTLNAHYPDDRAVTGRLDGWIHQLGVLRSHRRRGIASALIAASLAAFHRAGFTHSALGVDSANPTGAYGLYERLGYRALHRRVVHELEV